MITSEEWFNPTKVCGLVAYGTALACCAFAYTRMKTSSKTRQGSQVAAALTLLESLMLIDIFFDGRIKLHDMFEGFAQSLNEYAARKLPQEIVLCVLGALLLFGLFRIWQVFRGRPGACLAVSGGLLSLIVWSTELISLHAMDHYFYYRLGSAFHPLGDLMAVTILWVLSAFMTSSGILIESGSRFPVVASRVGGATVGRIK